MGTQQEELSCDIVVCRRRIKIDVLWCTLSAKQKKQTI